MAEPKEVPAEQTFAKGWDAPMEGEVKLPEEKKEPEPQKEEPKGEEKKEPEPQPKEKEPEKKEPPAAEEKPDPKLDVKHEKPSREQRIDEKKPDEPIALSHWNRWRTASTLLEKEREQRKLLEAQLETERAAKVTKVEEKKDPVVDPEVAIDELEVKYTKALRDGDSEESLKSIRREIRVMERKMAQEGLVQSKDLDSRVDARASEVVTVKDEQAAVDQVAAQAITDYPFLDFYGETPHHGAIRYVKATTAEYVAQGMKRPEALSQAIEDAKKDFAVFSISKETPVEKKPIDEKKLQEMAPVEKKGAPVKIDQKAKGSGSFGDGWSLPVTN